MSRILLYDHTISAYWTEPQRPSIHIEATIRRQNEPDPKRHGEFQEQLEDTLNAMHYPVSAPTQSLLSEAARRVRTILQMMGGVEWVRVSLGGQSVTVSLSVEE